MRAVPSPEIVSADSDTQLTFTGTEPSTMRTLPASEDSAVLAANTETCVLKPVVAPQLRLKTTAFVAWLGESVLAITSFAHPMSHPDVPANATTQMMSFALLFMRSNARS